MVPDRFDCPHAGCNSVNVPAARFCGHCGRPLEPWLNDSTSRSILKILGWSSLLLIAPILFWTFADHSPILWVAALAGVWIVVPRHRQRESVRPHSEHWR